VFEFLKAGGWLMFPILLCSVVALAICVERFWTLNPRRVAPPNLLAQVWGWIKNNQLDAQKMKYLRQSSPLGHILATGLSNSRHGREVMKESIEESAGHVVHDLERYIDPLGTIAIISPLLGLLGTVIGMIKVFSEIMVQGAGNANVLAGGISEALITTATGLCVAIPAMIMHRYFNRRVDSIVVSMEQETIKLVDALHGERKVDYKEKQAR
jgi:biopolymer transport protein ExbB